MPPAVTAVRFIHRTSRCAHPANPHSHAHLGSCAEHVICPHWEKTCNGRVEVNMVGPLQSSAVVSCTRLYPPASFFSRLSCAATCIGTRWQPRRFQSFSVVAHPTLLIFNHHHFSLKKNGVLFTTSGPHCTPPTPFKSLSLPRSHRTPVSCVHPQRTAERRPSRILLVW
jgi:hypothetical protein